MRPLLLTLIVVAFAAAGLGQPVTWESLNGPYGGYVPLVGTVDGTAFRGFDDRVERSDDGGITWTDTGFPGLGIRRLDMGHDGALLAATTSGTYRLFGGVWAAIGPEGTPSRRAGADSAGNTYVWLSGCTFARAVDLDTWETFTPWTDWPCIDFLVASDGEVLVIRSMYETVLSYWVEHSTDGGELWTSRNPGELVQHLVSGQHGGTFAIAPPGDDGYSGLRPPRTYRWTGGVWEVVATEHVTAVTTTPGGDIVFGFRHGFHDEPLDGPLAWPLDLVLSTKGAWLAGTRFAGMWRWSSDTQWYQIFGGTAQFDFLERDQQSRLVASVFASHLYYDGTVWRHGQWTRYRTMGMASLPERALVASPGQFGDGIESAFEPAAGVWDVEADQVVVVDPSCDEWAPCVANSMIQANGTVFAGLGGTALVCRAGDTRCGFGQAAGLYRSLDAGETWSPSLAGFGNLCHLSSPGGDVVWAGAGEPGSARCPQGFSYPPSAERVYVSTDLGDTWQVRGADLPSAYVTAIAADTQGAVVALPDGQVFRVPIDGDVLPIGSPGPEVQALGLSFNGAPLAGTVGGLYAFDGVNWQLLGFSGLDVSAIRVGPDGIVYLATSEGVYRTEQPMIVSANDMPEVSMSGLRSIFPNPTRGEVSVTLHLQTGGQVVLTLFDVLGRRVLVPLDRLLDAGEHDVTLSVAGLASGVYFLQFETAETRIVQRLTIAGP